MTVRKIFRLVAPIIGSLILATGCSTQPRDAIHIDSASAISVEVTEKISADRIVALANGSAEIIAALGHKRALVGRDIASSEALLKDIPIVTSGHQVIAEPILKLRPDLLIIDDATGPLSAIKLIEDSGVKVVKVRQAWTLRDIAPKVDEIAKAIGALKSGSELEKTFANSLANISVPSQKVRIAFLYLRGGSSIYLLGGKGSGADSLISAVNGVDVGADFSDKPFSPMTAEAIAQINPDLILVMSKGLESVGGVSGLRALPGVGQTSAGRNSRILAVDDSLLLSFGPRTPNLLAQMATAIDQAMR